MVDMDMYFTIMVDRQSPFAGEVYYRVTEESLTDHLNTKLHEARLQIDKNCRLEDSRFILWNISMFLQIYDHVDHTLAKKYNIMLT